MLVPHRAPPQVADRGTPPRYGWYRGNEIPGADKNWLGEGTPNTKPKMEKCVQNNVPQGSTNLPAGSDRVEAPVAGAGLTNFGGDQTHRTQKGKKGKKEEAEENNVGKPRTRHLSLERADDNFHHFLGDKVIEMKQNIDLSESFITKALENAKNARKQIKAAMLKQKNVSSDIKTGAEIIAEALDVIESTKRRQKLEQENLTGLLWNRARTLNSSVNTPTQNMPTQKKRIATSPAESQGATPVDKRKKDNTTKND